MPILTAPDYKERILNMGTNGSGKSELTKQLIVQGYPRTISIDLKGDFDPDLDATVIKKPDDYRWRWKGNGHIIYRPSKEYRNKKALEYVMWNIYERAQKEGKRKPFIIYIDEMLLMAKYHATEAVSGLAVASRSLRAGLWVSSQRPLWIPVEIRTEAWRWYVFYLQSTDDQKEVFKYTGGNITYDDLQRLGNYDFYEIKRLGGGKQSVQYFPPLQGVTT